MTYTPISQKPLVHFRVRSVGQTPKTPIPTYGFAAMHLRVEYVSEPGAQGFTMPAETLAPYYEALAEAVRSQAVYWVDLDYSGTRHLGPQPDDATLDRFMKAVLNGQIVESDSEHQ